jgi:hypothetical protein
MRGGGFAADSAAAHQFGQRLFHADHSIVPAGGNRTVELVIFTLADQAAYTAAGHQDLHCRIANGFIAGRNQLLRDHGQQRQRKLLADLGLIRGGKRIQDARYRLRRIVGMERGKHQVAGFSRRKDGGHGFRIAHFPGKNYIRVLAKNAPQGPGKIRRVLPDFDLFDDRLPVGVNELDRVFDCHHVDVPVGVDQIHQGSERGAFAASSGSGNQHQALARFSQMPQHSRKIKRFKRRNFLGQQTHAACQRTALIVQIGAETAHAIALKT